MPSTHLLGKTLTSTDFREKNLREDMRAGSALFYDPSTNAVRAAGLAHLKIRSLFPDFYFCDEWFRLLREILIAQPSHSKVFEFSHRCRRKKIGLVDNISRASLHIIQFIQQQVFEAEISNI